MKSPVRKPITPQTYNLRLKRQDYVLLMLVSCISFYIFASANKYFSYDYSSYMEYFDNLAALSLDELRLNMLDNAPFFYVSLPPTGLFECGFASVAWLLLQLSDSSSVTYAVIAATSITTRFFLLRKMGVKWGWLLLINIYAITLFEANAIRLGCSFTFFLLGILFVLQQRSRTSVFLIFGVSALFHLQILFEVSLFLVLLLGWRVLMETRARLSVLIIATVVFTTSAIAIVEQTGLSKLEDYVGSRSTSGGITVVSSLAILAWFLFSWKLVTMTKEAYSQKIAQIENLSWVAISMAGLPSLMLYAFVDNVGAMGERFWQIAFMSAASIIFSGEWKKRIGRTHATVFHLLVLVASINVLYRYPLSNFFYPLTPFTFITP